MPHLTIVASPTPDVRLTRYDAAVFPKFRQLFEPAKPDSPLAFLVRDPAEAAVSLVLENLSCKGITALRHRWLIPDENGEIRRHTSSSDSYMVDVFRPVVAPGSRQLISPSMAIDESLIDHILSGGGVIGCGTARSFSLDVADITFEILLVVFDDGEICGLDPDRYAGELQCRKPAADFVAKQIRLAESEQRDVTPVLAALASVPHLRDDFLAKWTQDYARRYLRRPTEATLRHLENRPVLPRFYRKQR